MERRDALDAISECAFVADVYRTCLDRSQTLRGLPQICFALAQDRDVRAVLEREPGRGFADAGRASDHNYCVRRKQHGRRWARIRRYRVVRNAPPYGIVLAAALIKMNRPTLPTCGTPKLHTG